MFARLGSPVLLYTALLLLRLEWIGESEIVAVVYLAAIDDLMVVLIAAALSLVASELLPWRWSWLAVSTPVWLATLADSLYFRFFGGRLEWWVAALHWRDISRVSDSIFDLTASWSVAASAIAFLSSVAAAFRVGLARRTSVAARLASAAALLAIAAVLHYAPIWAGAVDPKRLTLRDHVLKVWLFDAAGWNPLMRDSPAREVAGDPREAAMHLASWRGGAGLYAPPEDAGWPLYVDLRSAETAELRVRLGLPTDGPVNAIVLFLETARAFELLDSELGPAVFPRLRAVLHRHGVTFTQAYSSSLVAVPTVRSQFTSLCSLHDNLRGPATFVARPAIRARCVQGLLREHGYTTVWANSFFKSAYNAELFESLHGTERFYDRSHFAARGITATIGRWGVADEPFLLEIFRVLEQTAGEGKPFFAALTTSSTHPPFRMIPEGRLPDGLVRATGGARRYRGYLSALRYLDHSLGAFFDAFFASPIASRTFVVAVGDHGTAVRPHFRLGEVQLHEIRFRVPLAIVTRDMPAPGRIDRPVHQLDVAPTIAAISGVAGKVTWIGRSLFSGEGSPWVYEDERGLSYRVRSRGCYSNEAGLRCWRIPQGTDPLFENSLEEIPEDPAETARFRDLVAAAAVVLTANAVAPRR